MRIAFVILMVLAAALLVYAAVDFRGIGAWAVEHQRAFQNQMAAAVRALRAGDPGAYTALMAGAAAYGFVHALGPGHGKYLIGGVGLGTSVPALRLVSVALVSSLAQALWAILIVYGGFALFELSAQRMTYWAESVLAPLSYLAIATVGLILVWRGIWSLPRRGTSGRALGHGHHHMSGSDDNCGCHTHGPSPEDVARLGSLREALVLICSIAIRPCTGAIFLLIIAWQMEIQMAGAVAVIVMGLGTAALTSLVALSTVGARGAAFASAGTSGALTVAIPALQILSGGLIVWISLVLLRFAL
ncbi:MAG: hypothetical protein AAF678_05995 [Pseudomonadota bacterium]